MGKEIWKIASRHDGTIMEDLLGAASLFAILFVAMHFQL